MTSQEFIESIVDSRKNCYFISPHLDDAVFSAGEMIARLSGKCNIKIINVFTSCGDGISTLSGYKYLKDHKAKSAKKLYESRVKEDEKAFKTLGLVPINLGFVDALWRKKQKNKSFIPEINSVYPTYRFHISKGKLSRYDDETYLQISEKIKKIIQQDEDFIVFCPIGIGGHVDHKLVRKICENEFGDHVVYWADIPYRFSKKIHNSNLLKSEYMGFELDILGNSKQVVSEIYQTQINQVISDKTILKRSELYLYKTKSVGYQSNLYDKLSDEIIKDWKNLWLKSQYSHFYNSYEWFESCLNVFRYRNVKIITIRQNGQLVSVLPLVKSKKYSVWTHTNAGEQLSDKSPILVDRLSSEIIRMLFAELSKLDSYYINEVSEDIAFFVSNIVKCNFSHSSFGYYQGLEINPLSYLNNKNKKNIEWIINNTNNLALSSSIRNFDSRLKRMVDIESRSYKVNSFKSALTDKKYILLLEELYKHKNIKVLSNILEINKKDIAFQIGFIAQKKLYWIQTAYDETIKNITPGKVMLYLYYKKIGETDINFIDYSRGDGVYKRCFTPYNYSQYAVYQSHKKTDQLKLILINSIFLIIQKYPVAFELIRIAKNLISHK